MATPFVDSNGVATSMLLGTTSFVDRVSYFRDPQFGAGALPRTSGSRARPMSLRQVPHVEMRESSRDVGLVSDPNQSMKKDS